MKRIPKVSEAEWQVMNVLWHESPLTVKEIVAILSKQTDWHFETIRTLVNQRGARARILDEIKQLHFEHRPATGYLSISAVMGPVGVMI